MKHKRIKSLEVSDFRGLQGTRVLDFESADIILLLGLNGFGKTSVFDAIEWCLTGKLGRYERYTETGRKQDFGKEKEVLRNKYATNPNTFAKLVLESGTTIGRRVLSNNNESDYNMGSIIDGCEYGLGSLAKEDIKPELANSYFSATHILSQETINHFVTSKKPEERYQALSVNFGTAIFTPFEHNVQMILGKITELEKELKQELKLKDELISTLRSQMSTKIKDISESLREANELIEVINELSPNIIHKTLSLEDNLVSMGLNFKNYVSNAYARGKLDYSEVKEQSVGIRFLKDNISRWKEDNKQLKIIETSMSKDKLTMVELSVIQKSISSIKSEISSLNEKLKPIAVQQANFQNAIEYLPHFIEVSKKISSIEAVIKKRNKSISVAKAKIPDIEKLLENKKLETTRIETKLKELQSVLVEMEKQQQFFTNYQSEQKAITDKIKNLRDTNETLRKKSVELHIVLKTLEASSEPSAIKNLFGNPEYRSLLPPSSVNMFSEILDNINTTQAKINKYNIEEKLLSDEETKMHKRFSESRQLLSNALSQIDKQQKEHLCPVCDAPHKTQSLISHIESKLGIDESDTLRDIRAKLSKTRNKKAENQAFSEELTQQFKGVYSTLKNSLRASMAKVTSESTMRSEDIDALTVQKGEAEDKYKQITTNIDRFLDLKPRNYTIIVSDLTNHIEQLKADLKEAEVAKSEMQKKFLDNEKLLRDGLKYNASNLSEIASIKDTKYVDVHDFLERNGIKPEVEELGDIINNHLLMVTKEEKQIHDMLKHQESLLAREMNKYENVLKEQSEENIRKRIVEKEEQLTKLRQSLNRFLSQLSQLGISPESYTNDNIKAIQESTEKKINNQETKINALDRLLTFITIFDKFNSDNANRVKVQQLEKGVESLRERENALGVAKKNINLLKKKYPSVLKKLIKKNLDVDLFNQIYELLNPHRRFKIIDFNVDVTHNKIGINFNAKHSKINARPEFLFSSAQLNTFGICMFLSMALRQNWLDLDTILIDDPIQNLDDINILSFIDFLRSLLDSEAAKKQILISTHDERFYDLMIRKFQDYNVKSFRFESYGKLTPDVLI